MDPELKRVLDDCSEDYSVSPNGIYIYAQGTVPFLLTLAEEIPRFGYRLKGGIQGHRSLSVAATFIKMGEPKTNKIPDGGKSEESARTA